MFKTS